MTSSTGRSRSRLLPWCLACACLTWILSAGAPWLGAQPTPATRIIYLHTRGPAAGLQIVQRLPNGIELPPVTTGADGRVTLTPRSQAVVQDPAAGNVVLRAFAVGETPPAELEVPEAIRIAGRLPLEEARQGIRLQYGYGPRLSAGQRFRAGLEPEGTVRPDDGHAFGLDLPASPRFWIDARVDADGAFLSGWVPANDRPQLIARTPAGQVAIEDVPIDGVTPHVTVQAGAFRFVQTRTLIFDFKGLPRPPLPADAQVSLRGARWREEDRAFVARYLSVLDRLDLHAYTFVAERRPFSLERIRTALTLLPPFTEIDVRYMGAVAATADGAANLGEGGGADVTITLSPDSSSSGLAIPTTAVATRTLPTGRDHLPLTGTVVRRTTYTPVADATVTGACRGETYETTTDRYGHFVLPRVCVGRRVTLTVNADDTSVPAQLAPAQTRLTLTHAAGPARPVVITLPERLVQASERATAVRRPFPDLSAAAVARARRNLPAYHMPLRQSPARVLARLFPAPRGASFLTRGSDGGGLGDGDGPEWAVSVFREVGDGQILYNPVLDAFPSQDYLDYALTVLFEGEWSVMVELGACIVLLNRSFTFETNKVAIVPVMPSRAPTPLTFLQVRNKSGGPAAAGTAVYLPSVVPDADPVEIDAETGGWVNLGQCAAFTVSVFVWDDAQGYFDGLVEIDKSGYGGVQLAKNQP